MVPLNILFANLNKLKWSFYLTIILASSFNILKSLKSAKRFGKLIFRKLLNIPAQCSLMLYFHSHTHDDCDHNMMIIDHPQFKKHNDPPQFCAKRQSALLLLLPQLSSSGLPAIFDDRHHMVAVIKHIIWLFHWGHWMFCIFFTLFVKDMYTSDYACFTLTLSFQHHVCVLWRDSWCH